MSNLDDILADHDRKNGYTVNNNGNITRSNQYQRPQRDRPRNAGHGQNTNRHRQNQLLLHADPSTHGATTLTDSNCRHLHIYHPQTQLMQHFKVPIKVQQLTQAIEDRNYLTTENPSLPSPYENIFNETVATAIIKLSTFQQNALGTYIPTQNKTLLSYLTTELRNNPLYFSNSLPTQHEHSCSRNSAANYAFMVPCFICHINSPTRDQLFNILQTPTKEELDSAFSKAKVATRLLSNRNLYQHYLTDVYPRKYIPKHCIETSNDSPMNMWNASHRYIGTLLSDLQIRFRDALPSQIPHYPNQNNQPTAEHSHRYNTYHQSSNAIQTHRNNRQYDTNPPHRNKSTTESAVVSFHTHPSHQQNDDDTANSTINTQEHFHRSSHHHPSRHTHQQHEHPRAPNTNMTYQDHSYTYDESTQHNDPTKTYNEQYEDTSQQDSLDL